MPRIRTVKPEMWVDDALNVLPVVARWIFAGLFCQADKSGRLEDRPEKIRVTVAPYEKRIDINAILQLLHDHKFIVRYEIDGHRYIQIRTWEKHQRPHHTECESDIPPRPDGEITVTAPLCNGDTPDGRDKGKDKGRDKGTERGDGGRYAPGVRPLSAAPNGTPPAVFGDDIWDAWREAGARHGNGRIAANANGANWPQHMRLIQSIIRDRAELDAALECWWASPHVTAGRNVGLFASQLSEVLAHLESGAARAFRDLKPRVTAEDEGKAQLAAWAEERRYDHR